MAVFHIGDVIRKLRLSREWGVEDLAEHAGVNKMTVSAIERGGDFKRQSIDKIAEAFGFPSAADLYRLVPPAGSPEAERTDEDIFTGYKPNDIPVIVEGHASPQPNLFWSTDGSLLSEVGDRMSRPARIRDPHAYGIRVIGDSMVPRFRPGERLIASPHDAISDGDEVYVELLSGERLIKEARRIPGGGWMLISYNASYPPRAVRAEDIGAMHRIIHIDTGKRGTRVVPINEPRRQRHAEKPRPVEHVDDIPEIDRGEED